MQLAGISDLQSHTHLFAKCCYWSKIASCGSVTLGWLVKYISESVRFDANLPFRVSRVGKSSSCPFACIVGSRGLTPLTPVRSWLLLLPLVFFLVNEIVWWKIKWCPKRLLEYGSLQILLLSNWRPTVEGPPSRRPFSWKPLLMDGPSNGPSNGWPFQWQALLMDGPSNGRPNYWTSSLMDGPSKQKPFQCANLLLLAS